MVRGADPFAGWQMRVAVIGCGRIAQVAHLPAMNKIPQMVLAGTFDASEHVAKAVAEQYGAVATTSLEECLGLDIDAVIVTVPDRAHAEITRRALEAGKHVLVEKPLTSSIAEGERLAALADASGCVLHVGTMKRHDPGVVYAREMIAERLGAVLSFSAWYRVSSLRANVSETLFPPLITDAEVTTREAAFKADTTGYWLATHGSHLWDEVRYLLGEVHALRARRANVGSDITWQAVAQLSGGGIGTIDLTVNTHGEGSEGMSVRCERGSLELRTLTPFAHRASEVRVYEDSLQAVTRPVLGYANAFSRQLLAFMEDIDALRESRAPYGRWGRAANARDGLAAVRLVQAVTASVERGEDVTIDA